MIRKPVKTKSTLLHFAQLAQHCAEAEVISAMSIGKITTNWGILGENIAIVNIASQSLT
jgi:hypothetical protein